MLNVTLLSSEWKSTKGGLSTISRELAIQLAKHPDVEVSVYLPQCSEEDKKIAATMVDKIPWDTCVIALIFGVFKAEFEKSIVIGFKMRCSPLHPPIQC